MFKVTMKEQPGSFTLVFEGRLCRPWTAEAEREWSSIESAAGDKEVLLDLAGVTFVDRDGEALLSSILARGARVRASGLLVSHVLEQVRQRMSRPDVPEERRSSVAAPACSNTPPSPKSKGPSGS
jgi:hypothetical protein